MGVGGQHVSRCLAEQSQRFHVSISHRSLKVHELYESSPNESQKKVSKESFGRDGQRSAGEYR